MRRRKLILPIVLGVVITSLLGCGNSTGLNPGLNLPESAYPGVTYGSWRAVRYNDWGYRDSSLNSTLSLTWDQTAATTTLVIGIDDTRPMQGVAMDLEFDAATLAPQSTDFSGLMETPVALAYSGNRGIVSLGQVALGEPQVRAGEFARIVFLNQPSRQVSAIPPAHSGPIDIEYRPEIANLPVSSAARGFEILNGNAEIGSNATYRIRALFTIGDGNGNGETEIGDLTPMISNGYFQQQVTATDFGSAQTDYSRDGVTNISDLTPIAQHLGNRTTGIEILLGDTPLLTASDLLQTLTWPAGIKPQHPPISGTTDWGKIFQTWEGQISMQQMIAADADMDNTVYISARPTNGLQPMVAFAGKELSYAQPFTPGTEITGFEIAIDGEPAPDGSVYTVPANTSGVPLAITGIIGSYSVDDQTYPFAPDSIPAEMTQATYDQALDDVRELVKWSGSANPDAGAGYRFVNPVIYVESDTLGGFLATFGADDAAGAESENGEGRLTATLPVAGTFVKSEVTVRTIIDLTADPSVPVFTLIESIPDDGAGNPRLSTSSDTTLFAYFNFGTDVPSSEDYSSLPVQLHDYTDPVLSLDLVWNTVDPLSVSEYTIGPNTRDPENGAALQLEAIIPGGNIVPGHQYGLRLQTDAWSSANYPSTAIPTDALPAPVTLVTLPPPDQLNPNTDYVRLFYPTPMLRRDPRVIVNEADQRVSPYDLNGWNDFIKHSGEAGEAEFPITFAGEWVFPQIVVVKDATPGTILPTSTSEDVRIVERTKGSLTIDISSITPNSGLGGGTYGFKLFGAAAAKEDWPEIGSGTWEISALPLSAPPIKLRDFGVNIFDDTGRGDLPLAARDYSASPTRKIIDADIVDGIESAVLYVEFTGGAVYDYALDPAAAYNPKLRLYNPARGDMTRPLIPRVAGLDIGGLPYLIASYTFEPSDWYSPADPVHTGVLQDGATVTVRLFDPNTAQETTFTTGVLDIVGTPN